MSGLLRFETATIADGLELSMLVDSDEIRADILPVALSIDGGICDIEAPTLHRLALAVEKMKNEKLPEGHFRDCVSFVMAMCGLWMPTHKLFERCYDCAMVHDDTVDSNSVRGPVSTGVPYNERFLGFEGHKYVYGHAAYVVDSSHGLLALHKLGVGEDFAISTVEDLLRVQNDDIVHNLDKLTVVHNGEETFRWER